MPLAYRVAIARLHERVRYQLEIENGLSKHFVCKMGVKRGCPLSSTFFGLCIEKLEKMVNTVAREEGLDAPKLTQRVSLFLIVVDYVIIFSYNVDDIQALLRALEAFCLGSGLTINVDKTEMMVV